MTVCGHTAHLYLTHHGTGLCLWLSHELLPHQLPSSFAVLCLTQTWPSKPVFAPNPQTLWVSCFHLAPSSALSEAMLLSFPAVTPPQARPCCTAWALLSCWAHTRGDFPGYFPGSSPCFPVLQLEWFAGALAVHSTGCCDIHELPIKPGGKEPGDWKPFLGNSSADVWQKAE